MAVTSERSREEYKVGDMVKIDTGLHGWYGVVVKAQVREELEIICIDAGFPSLVRRRGRSDSLSLVNGKSDFINGLRRVMDAYKFEIKRAYEEPESGETQSELQARKLSSALAARRKFNLEHYVSLFSDGKSPDSIVKQEPPVPESSVYVVAPVYGRNGQDFSKLKGLIINPRRGTRVVHFKDYRCYSGTKVITSEMGAAEFARGYLEFDAHVDPRADFNGFKAYEVPEAVRSLVVIPGTLIVNWEEMDGVFRRESKLLQ